MFIVVNKKSAIISCIILCCGLLLGGIFGVIPDKSASGVGRGEEVRIIIDAGHGLPDGGATGINGAVESELNLDIAQKLSEILENMGFDTVMTRSDKNGITEEGSDGWNKVTDMKIRRRIMKQEDAQLFISIHMNHFTSRKVSGLRLFYADNHKQIKELAENIQEKIGKITGAEVTSVRAADKSLFLMKSPPLPAVLIECGFLSNVEEERKLTDEKYRSQIAWAIAKEVENYYFGSSNKTNQLSVENDLKKE